MAQKPEPSTTQFRSQQEQSAKKTKNYFDELVNLQKKSSLKDVKQQSRKHSILTGKLENGKKNHLKQKSMFNLNDILDSTKISPRKPAIKPQTFKNGKKNA